MQHSKHPKKRLAVFRDVNTQKQFIMETVQESNATVEYEGSSFPLILVTISSNSHPFYQKGENSGVTIQGRSEKFLKRYQKSSP